MFYKKPTEMEMLWAFVHNHFKVNLLLLVCLFCFLWLSPQWGAAASHSLPQLSSAFSSSLASYEINKDVDIPASFNSFSFQSKHK